MPFCAMHANALPVQHKEKLWKGRRRDETMDPCAACDPCPSDEVRLERSGEWDKLYYLGIAILLKLDFGGCGAPPPYQDETGFCWACGIDDALKNEAQAEGVIHRFGLVMPEPF